MRPDLHDAYAAYAWAITQLESLRARIGEWHARPAYRIVEEARPDLGKKLFKLQADERLGDSLINAEVGAIINSLRSALDLLAASLARRNGVKPTADNHFPFAPTPYDFIDPIAVAKRKKWLAPAELKIIESLKPYPGGDDELWAVHRLDITRKHDRLIKLTVVPNSLAIDPPLHLRGLISLEQWDGFDDDAVIASGPISAPHCDLQITCDIRFDETALLPNPSIIPALRRFCGAVATVIQLFERTP